MKYIGVNDIYFTNCPSSIMDPALTEWMKKLLKLKSYTTPNNDYKDILKGISQ
jgi:hypothetical protein